MALGVVEAARELKIKIPEELGVVSFNDTIYCTLVDGGLTSVSLNLQQIVRTACQRLLQVVEGGDVDGHSLRTQNPRIKRKDRKTLMTAMFLALIAFQPDSRPYVFTYQAEKEVKRASVAGSFNNWNKDASPLKVGPDGRTWTATIPLKPGKYTYKFVIDGENWITDPKALRNEDDGNGNLNSVLLVYPADYSEPATVGDGRITGSAVHHSQKAPDLNVDKGKISLTVTVRPHDVNRLSMIVGNAPPIPMTRLFADEVSETWRGSLPFDGAKLFTYAFELQDGPKRWVYGPKGVTEDDKTNRFSLKPGEFKPFLVPSWVEGTVFYQIFPDRFANGESSNDPKEMQPWSAEPTYYNRYGGDAVGVSSHVNYLKSLGVGTVYFNPVMKAPSNHRYDPVDYYQIDPEFGTNGEFAKLTQQLQSVGIRTVVDQIFDHIGTTFAPFADVLKNQENSKYKDWFFIKSYPVSVKQNPPYEAWFGAESMPKINVKNPEAYAYLMKSVDFWHKTAKLSGWRLDVANEVPDFFWQDFRKRVKGIDPQAWIVGEVWGDARHWLGGDMWDASMNYPFRDAVLHFIAEGKSKPSQCMAQLMSVYGWYAPQVSRNQMNLLSSHDTPRFLTLCGGDKRLAKLGAAIQFAWVGAPSVYYGEELGMEGGADPQNRRPMRWDLAKDDNDMLSLYRKLIKARRSTRALQVGDPVPLLTDDTHNTLAFARVEGTEVALLCVNRSDQEQTVSVPLRVQGRSKIMLRDLIGTDQFALQTGNLRMSLPPLSFKLLAGTLIGDNLTSKSLLKPNGQGSPAKSDGGGSFLFHPSFKESL
jgi:glycosidase